MNYDSIQKAVFLSRPNRFIARILLNGEEKICHVKNTGRCKELLIPGCEIYVQEFPDSVLPKGSKEDAKEPSLKKRRKTSYDLISVQKGDRLINMDSLAPNKVAAELLPSLFPTLLRYRTEKCYGDSRFDFAGDYIPLNNSEGIPGEDTIRSFFLEVKGVTLEQNGTVLFPDAPTARGSKHLTELVKAKNEGYDAAALFIIQMENVTCFRPNEAMDPAFALSLRRAAEAGVRLLAYDCHVTPDSITPRERVPIFLSE